MHRKSTKYFLFALLLVVSMTGGLSACRNKREASVVPSVVVELLTARKQALQRPIIVFGQTEAHLQSQLAFQVAGVVSKVSVEEGDPVKANQVLAELDKESINLNMRLSQARYWEAATQYRKFKKGYRKELVKQQYSLYKKAEAAYRKASSDLESAKKLQITGAISKEQYTAASTQYQTALAAKNQAYQGYMMYLRGYEKEDIQMASVKTSQARTQLKLAQKQLKDTKLRAPFDGVIAQKKLNVGELVSQQVPGFLLMDLSKIRVKVGVPERVIDQVVLGQRALLFSRPGKVEAIGSIERKGVVLDKATLTYPVEILVPNPIVRYEKKKPIRKLLPGKAVLVGFPRDKAPQGIAIPIDAVLNDGASKYVYINDNQKAKRVNVKTSDTHHNNIVITQGLKGGEQVVVAGQHQLDEGRRLFVLKGNTP